MKKLIVNADDFGLHPLINQGIIKGYREGFITSTSLMPSAPAFSQAVELAKAAPGLGLGIHLTLVGGGEPLLPKAQVASLLDGRGLFPQDYLAFARRFYGGAVKEGELEAELRAQIERVLATGLPVTHLDSHQHLHVLPGLSRLVLRLALDYGLKALRIPAEPYGFRGGCSAGLGRYVGKLGLSFWAGRARQAAARCGLKFPSHFYGMLAGGRLNPALVANILRALPEGSSELMTHPGLDSQALGQAFPWHYHWQDELAAYLDTENQALLQQSGIKLITFGEL